VGDPKRIALIAADLVAHFEKRLEAMDGKAMIVCMSRRICVDLYNALIKLRPDWASAANDDAEAEKGKACVVKVVMTGSADDGPDWQPHIRSKDKRRKLANRFKDAKDPFRIVIVRDMWLTGFDAPCLHTMYADKPMQGHGLMQAIARVNRVFRDKPGGLVVDYLGLADQLKRALATYTESGGQGEPDLRHRAGHRRDAGEARHRLRPDARLQLGQVDHRHARRAPRNSSPPGRSTSSNRKTARSAGCRW
jgi:type I restriction enzyme R subunit